ncbi:hypothetical protein B4114_0879 [Geobacillus stearothermophilus]|uniref:Uncharacterized protein n=1 Tax=Geobacillus stearothermophilus TaxID=1422 RepID=A0A150N9A1_GEOSE|nr:hypothetical protein B4114_0879 [Geobacillus stearothermophilus]
MPPANGLFFRQEHSPIFFFQHKMGKEMEQFASKEGDEDI